MCTVHRRKEHYPRRTSDVDDDVKEQGPRHAAHPSLPTGPEPPEAASCVCFLRSWRIVCGVWSVLCGGAASLLRETVTELSPAELTPRHTAHARRSARAARDVVRGSQRPHRPAANRAPGMSTPGRVPFSVAHTIIALSRVPRGRAPSLTRIDFDEIDETLTPIIRHRVHLDVCL